MSAKHIRFSWALAIFSVLFLWGINNLLLGVGAKLFHGNAIIYSCTAFTTGSLVLLLYAGVGPLARETLRSMDTWVYGLTLLIGYSLSFVLYSYVSSTEGTLLQRLSVVVSLLIGFFFLARKPTKGQVFSALLLLFGVYLIMKGVEEKSRVSVYIIMILFAFFQAMRIFSAEYHRPHARAARDDKTPSKSKARVVGFVMFIVSISFTFLSLLFAFLQGSVGAENVVAGLPTLTDFFNIPNVLLGLFAGAFILAPLLLIEFRASHEIKSENYLALTSLAALSTWFWEWLTLPLTGFNFTSFTLLDIVACVCITVGGFSIAMLSYHKSKKPQPLEEYLKLCGFRGRGKSC